LFCLLFLFWTNLAGSFRNDLLLLWRAKPLQYTPRQPIILYWKAWLSKWGKCPNPSSLDSLESYAQFQLRPVGGNIIGKSCPPKNCPVKRRSNNSSPTWRCTGMSQRAARTPFQISNLKFQIQMIARMLYGCGLRVSEPLNLRIKDVHLQTRRLCIRGAKGGNDRVVALPLSLIPELTQQMHFAREVWQKRFALWDGAGTPKTQKNLGKHTVGTLGRLNHPPYARAHGPLAFSLQPFLPVTRT